MVNYNDFRPPQQQFGDRYSQGGHTPDGANNRFYKPPKSNTQFNTKPYGGSFDFNQDFVRHGLGFLSQSGQSSFNESDYGPKQSRFLKPVKFTRPVGDKYLQLDSFISTTGDPSIPITTTATPATKDFTELVAAAASEDKKNGTSIDNKTVSDLDKKPNTTIEEKSVKEETNTNNNSSNNNGVDDVSKSKDQEEISADHVTEDKVIVEDFVHGTYVDEDELETILKKGYDKYQQSCGIKEQEARGKNMTSTTTTMDMKSSASTSTSTIGLMEDNKDIKEETKEETKEEGQKEDGVSDTEQDIKSIYRKEMKSRRKRDKKKAERELHNSYPNGFNDYSQYTSPHYQSPQYPQYQYQPSYDQASQYPPSQYPPSQYPPSHYPPSQYPPSQYLNSPYPPSNYPPPHPSQYAHPQYPPPQHPSSQPYPTDYLENAPQGQQLSEKELQKQRRKRLREQLKAEKKAQSELGATPSSANNLNSNLRQQNMDPRDLEELQRLEEVQQRKAEMKAQRKLERDERRIEQSMNPEFVRMMYNVDEQIRSFISDSTMTSYQFEPLPTEARKQLHVIAALYGLQSKSYGNPKSRYTTITKTSDTYLPEFRQKIESYIFGNQKDHTKIIMKNRAKGKTGKEVAAGALPLNEENKGHRMLSAMGWKQGDSLGTSNDGIVAPVKAVIRHHRKGLGS